MSNKKKRRKHGKKHGMMEKRMEKNKNMKRGRQKRVKWIQENRMMMSKEFRWLSLEEKKDFYSCFYS